MQYFWPLYRTIIPYATLCLILHIKLFDNSSMSDYFQLIEEETNLINLLRVYVEVENTRLNTLQKFENLLIQNKELNVNLNEFAWNPLAIYRSIKYLTIDLNEVKKNMTTNSYDDLMLKIFPRHIGRLPDEDHLHDEVLRLIGMQRAYNLTASDIMGGYRFDKVFAESALTIRDCFYIGTVGALKDDHEITTSWLPGCRNEFDDDTQLQISRMIISSAFLIGDKSLAQTEVGNYLRKDSADRVMIDLNTKLTKDSGNWTDAFLRRYRSRIGCAGDFENEPALRSLKCRYNHHNSFFLTIAPLKEEILSFQPKVSIFRNVIHDSEIDSMKNDTYHRIETGIVIKKGVLKYDVRYRSCQRAFLDTFHHDPKYYNLRNRLSDMSSLSLKFMESPHTLYYTPGGFYREHSDFITKCVDYCSVTGNRVASTLMYLNDVALGGELVFPLLKLTVKPAKGSAIFYVNMLVDGTKNLMNDHAACPVIYGEKIACVAPFRARGQDHWFSEPEDDAKAHHSFNPNIRCLRRDSEKD